MNITVNVDDVTLSSVIETAYDDEGGPLHGTLGDAVARRIVEKISGTSEWSTLRTEVQTIRRDLIRERVALEIEAALSGPVNITNHWGESTGKTTTLREEIARMAAELLKVDRRNDYGRNLTPAQQVIRDMVDNAMARELAAVVAAEKEKVVAAVRAKAAELIADAVKQGIGR
jgi:hypothetical protein